VSRLVALGGNGWLPSATFLLPLQRSELGLSAALRRL